MSPRRMCRATCASSPSWGCSLESRGTRFFANSWILWAGPRRAKKTSAATIIRQALAAVEQAYPTALDEPLDPACPGDLSRIRDGGFEQGLTLPAPEPKPTAQDLPRVEIINGVGQSDILSRVARMKQAVVDARSLCDSIPWPKADFSNGFG
mmetsp:Transcript_40276/g.105788  ORF Transcript_40276/g.105788 Transcript_40276/m.105788 type:complete len:152 (-) Transcript_40276:60-515(-)